jgi:hypothetical protein
MFPPCGFVVLFVSSDRKFEFAQDEMSVLPGVGTSWSPKRDPIPVPSEFDRGLSWMPPRCGRSRVKRDTCVAYGHPSSNLGRNLCPRGVVLPHPIQQVQATSDALLPASTQVVTIAPPGSPAFGPS